MCRRHFRPLNFYFLSSPSARLCASVAGQFNGVGMYQSHVLCSLSRDILPDPQQRYLPHPGYYVYSRSQARTSRIQGMVVPTVPKVGRYLLTKDAPGLLLGIGQAET